MSFRYKKLLQTATLFLVVCVANGYVFAFLPDGNKAGAIQPKDLSVGVLSASEPSSVLVNGNTAQNGMTILSGAEIKTNPNSGATIELRQLGKIEINAESSVKLTFTDGQVDVQVLSGQAKLTTFRGVNGVLTDAAGKTFMTDSALEVSSVGNSAIVADAATAAAPAVESGGLFGMGILQTAVVVGGVVGGTMLAVVAASETSDASESPVSRVRP